MSKLCPSPYPFLSLLRTTQKVRGLDRGEHHNFVVRDGGVQGQTPYYVYDFGGIWGLIFCKKGEMLPVFRAKIGSIRWFDIWLKDGIKKREIWPSSRTPTKNGILRISGLKTGGNVVHF